MIKQQTYECEGETHPIGYNAEHAQTELAEACRLHGVAPTGFYTTKVAGGQHGYTRYRMRVWYGTWTPDLAVTAKIVATLREFGYGNVIVTSNGKYVAVDAGYDDTGNNYGRK